MSVGTITILLFAGLFLLLAFGLPIALSLGAMAAIFCVAFWGFDHLPTLALAAFTTLQNANFVAIPLFIFMGWIVYRSGIADDIFDAITAWLGNMRGGVAIGTIVLSALFGAICGDMVAAIFTITAIALPPLLKRGTSSTMASGTILAGSLLSFLIPPSIVLIIYCTFTNLSIGRMYFACFIPGFLLALLYSIVIMIVYRYESRSSQWNKEVVPSLQGNISGVAGIDIKGPTITDFRTDMLAAPGATAYAAVSASRDEAITWGVKLKKLKGIGWPLVLFIAMIGGIYQGIVTPMEASSVGATGALLIALAKRRLSWATISEALFSTGKLTCMLAWLIMGASCFTIVYNGLGSQTLALQVATFMPGGGLPVVIIMQVVLVIVGMFLDVTAIILIFGPIFQAIIVGLGFDPIWFGVLFMINIQIALMSPPYGTGLFFQRTAIENLEGNYAIGLDRIIRGSLPFIAAQITCLALVLFFPDIALFLPELLIK